MSAAVRISKTGRQGRRPLHQDRTRTFSSAQALGLEGRRSIARGVSPWTAAPSNGKAPAGRQTAASTGWTPPTNAPNPSGCAGPRSPRTHFGCPVAPLGLGCSGVGDPGACAPGYQPWLLRSRNTQRTERPQHRHLLQRPLVHRAPGKNVAVRFRADGRAVLEDQPAEHTHQPARQGPLVFLPSALWSSSRFSRAAAGRGSASRGSGPRLKRNGC